MSVKRYPVSNGLLIVRGKEAYDTFNLQNVMVVLATDYDALAASVDRPRLAAELAAEQESNTFLNNLHTVDQDRLRALEAALREITRIGPLGVDTYPECYRRIQKIAETALEMPVNPTIQHEAGCALLYGGGSCSCNPTPLEREVSK